MLSKAVSQRPPGWRVCLAQLWYVIQHISGAENHWSDVDEGRPCVRARAIAKIDPAMGDFNMLSKGKTRDRQNAVVREEPMLDTPLRKVIGHEDGLY